MPKTQRDRSDSVTEAAEQFFAAFSLTSDARHILARWLQHIALSKGFAANTLLSYRNDIADFLRFFAAHTGEELTLEHFSGLHISDLRGWIASRHEEGKSLTSSHRAMSTLRNLYRYLAKHHAIEAKAPFELRLAPAKAPLPKALNIDEVMRLINAYDGGAREPWIEVRDKALLLLMYGCGLRISEALSVTLAEAHSRNAFVRVVGKGSKTRETPVLPIVREALERLEAMCPHCAHQPPSSPLFYGLRGNPLQAAVFSKQLQQLRRELGLPESTTAHAMRHSYATHLLTEGANLRDVQELLGHENLSTTQRYTKVDIQHLMQSYSKAHPTSKTEKEDV
jgi:integrase/recombinase XerC